MRTSALLLVLWLLPAVAAKPPAGVESFRAGEREFKLGHFERALAAFEEAYRLDALPAMLVNVAQCYRALGKPTEAARALKIFLTDAPSHPLRDSAKKTLDELEAELAAKTPAVAPAEAAPADVPPSSTLGTPALTVTPAALDSRATPSATVEESSGGIPGWVWGVGAGVVAAVGAGVAVAVVVGNSQPANLGRWQLP